MSTTRRLRLWRSAAVLFASAFLVTVWPAGNKAPAHAPTTPSTTVCQEDDACWDWRTMGNKCGRDNPTEPIRCYR